MICSSLGIGYMRATNKQRLAYFNMQRNTLILCEKYLSQLLARMPKKDKNLRKILLELNRIIEATPINMVDDERA